MIRRGAVTAWITLAGCLGAPPHAEHEAAGPHDDAHDEHAEGEAGHASTPGLLRVGADVLRDLRVTTASATVATGSERATVLGELAIDEERYGEVGSPVAARVTRLIVAAGDEVRAGAPLVELESAELGRARAELAGARARQAAAERTIERKRPLVGGAVSERELQDALADRDTALAEALASEAALRAFGVGTGADGGGVFVLRSPVSGVVLTRDAHVGQQVEPHDTLARVADLSHLWLIAHAFERDALRVSEGGAAEVTLAALPNRAFAGTVARVGREVDATSRTVPIRLDLPNEDGLLRPGMSATALLPLGGAGGVLTVPAMAVQRCEAGWCVFLPRDEGAFDVRPVGRGRELGGAVEILSGLAAGEIVVVEGAFLLRAESAKQAGGGDEHEH